MARLGLACDDGSQRLLTEAPLRAQPVEGSTPCDREQPGADLAALRLIAGCLAPRLPEGLFEDIFRIVSIAYEVDHQGMDGLGPAVIELCQRRLVARAHPRNDLAIVPALGGGSDSGSVRDAGRRRIH